METPNKTKIDLIWEKYALKNENKTDVMYYENFCDAVEEIQKTYATQLLQEILDEMPEEESEINPDTGLLYYRDFNKGLVTGRNECRDVVFQTILNKAKREGLEVKEK